MGEPNYKISVVIPVYNAEAYLPRALASLEAQTLGFDRLEVLLVDDHSTDGSWAMVRQYAAEHSNVVPLQTEANSGSASVPRNLALEHIHAPYVMFLDNDDFFEQDACRLLYEEAEATGADLVSGYYRDVTMDGQPINARADNCTETERIAIDLTKDRIEMLKVEMIFWCKIYRAEIIKANQIRFLPKTIMEDVLFLAQYMLCCKSLVYINELIYNFVARSTSLSRTHSLRFVLDRATGYHKLKEIYYDGGCPECFTEYARYLADYYISVIFTSELFTSPEQCRTALEQWKWLVQYTLDKGLYVADDEERRLFGLLAEEKYDDVMCAYPRYLISRKEQELESARSELARIDGAYQGLNTAYQSLNEAHQRLDADHQSVLAAHQHLQSEYNLLQADRDNLQAKLNKFPLYRIGKFIKKLMKK